jgi:hypothetical protein
MLRPVFVAEDTGETSLPREGGYQLLYVVKMLLADPVLKPCDPK